MSVKPVSYHPKAFLAERGLGAKKSFGQNFLVDDSHLSAIAKAVAALAQQASLANLPVVEYGAGLGALTRALLQEGLQVLAVERDRDLVPLLGKQLEQAVVSGQLTIEEANATTYEPTFERFVLCGNLPYHLSSSLLFRTLDFYERISGAVYLLQKEVADRIAAKPGSRDYGLLSVLLQARFKASVIREVKSGAFWPPPKVDSAVLFLATKPQQEQVQVDFALLTKVVKDAFAKRRKTLRNALCAHIETLSDASLQKIEPFLGRRAEELSVEDFAFLTSAFKSGI